MNPLGRFRVSSLGVSLGCALLLVSLGTCGVRLARAADGAQRIDATVHGNFIATGATNVLAGTLTDRALGAGARVERTQQGCGVRVRG